MKKLIIDEEKYDALYKHWAHPPQITGLKCSCGEKFNGVGGGRIEFCPYCGKDVLTSRDCFHIPFAEVRWSKTAIVMGLDKCFKENEE